MQALGELPLLQSTLERILTLCKFAAASRKSVTSFRWDPSGHHGFFSKVTVFEQSFSRPKKKQNPDGVRRGNLHELEYM
jgi:hypothetical protein